MYNIKIQVMITQPNGAHTFLVHGTEMVVRFGASKYVASFPQRGEENLSPASMCKKMRLFSGAAANQPKEKNSWHVENHEKKRDMVLHKLLTM